MRKKRHLTLLETLIVMALILLVAGTIGINVRYAIHDQQFRTESAQVVESFRLAQDLMLILNTDTRVKFKQEPNGILTWLDVESELAPKWEKLIKRPPKLLKAITSVEFNDALSYPTKEGEVEIRFLSKGSVMSSGVVYLKGAGERMICLQGHPHPIQLVETVDDCAEEDLVLDDRLTQITIEEVRAKNEKT